MQKKSKVNIVLLLAVAALILIFAVWGPENISKYRDRQTLNQVKTETVETVGEGYRYTLGMREKLYILGKCLNSQTQPASELSELTKVESGNLNYEDLIGTYAFVVNHQGPSDREITEAEVFDVCNRELAALKEQGVLPDEVKEVNASAYSAVLYSAIDVLEPRNNVSVWKVNLATGKQNADKSGRLLDAYIDADTGKFYEFYVRTKTTWDAMDAERMVSKWADYMGLPAPNPYDFENPLLENTPYYEKYRFSGIEGGSTVVTLGFYEGINELYLKISR